MYAYTVMQNMLPHVCITSNLRSVFAGAANIILDILAQMQQKYNDNHDSCERMALLIVGKPQTGRQTHKSCFISIHIQGLCPQPSHLTHATSSKNRWHVVQRLLHAFGKWMQERLCC